MTESATPPQRFAAQSQEQSTERNFAAASADDASEAWRSIARAAWTKNEITAASMPDISRQNLNEMLGLTARPAERPGMQYPALQDQASGRSLIDWNALAAGKTITINPLPERQTTGLGLRQLRASLPPTAFPDINQGRDRLSPSGNLDFNRLDAKRLLEPVRDQNILARVPDALYIGQKGLVTSTRNRSGETQDYWLSGSAAQAFARAQEQLAAKGKSIIVSDKNGAGRTVDTQTEIRSRSRNGRDFAAGKPTLSNHTRGNAMDVSNWQDPDVKRALLANGWRQGDSKGPIKGDLHHFSFAGVRQQDAPDPPQRHHRRHRH